VEIPTEAEIQIVRAAVHSALQILSDSRCSLRDRQYWVCIAVDGMVLLTSTLEASESLFERLENVHACPPF
jgi:hypothetical protein